MNRFRAVSLIHRKAARDRKYAPGDPGVKSRDQFDQQITIRYTPVIWVSLI
ncbi:MAG TPA: hypothetical protein VKA38_07125 [Draconibacterium sp.]|nr:hypothetical protein [Draconibacterium sp.]